MRDDTSRRQINAAFRPVWSTRDVSEYWNLSEKAIRRSAAIGAIPSFKIGGKLRFHRDEIEDFGR